MRGGGWQAGPVAAVRALPEHVGRPDDVECPAYVERRPPAALRAYVARTWAGSSAGRAPEQVAEPVLPDGCMDIMWDGRRLLVSGPDTRPVTAEGGAPFFVGVRMRPGAGPRFLGLPAGELRDQRLDLELAWPEAGQLAGELSEATSLGQAGAMLERALWRRLPSVGRLDPLVEAVTRDWRTPTATLAAGAGISERQVHRRFVEAVGYGPKFLQRVLRFQAFLAAASSMPAARLGELAASVGYADQPHLTREARALAGMTPAELRANRVRNVQDIGRRPA